MPNLHNTGSFIIIASLKKARTLLSESANTKYNTLVLKKHIFNIKTFLIYLNLKEKHIFTSLYRIMCRILK